MQLRIYKRGEVYQTVEGRGLGGGMSVATMKQVAKRRLRQLARFGDWVHVEIVGETHTVKGKVNGYRLIWEPSEPR